MQVWIILVHTRATVYLQVVLGFAEFFKLKKFCSVWFCLILSIWCFSNHIGDRKIHQCWQILQYAVLIHFEHMLLFTLLFIPFGPLQNSSKLTNYLGGDSAGYQWYAYLASWISQHCKNVMPTSKFCGWFCTFDEWPNQRTSFEKFGLFRLDTCHLESMSLIFVQLIAKAPTHFTRGPQAF